MAKNFYQPTRMCISCRVRDAQNRLTRLQCFDGSLKFYSGSGRSFYICSDCLNQEKLALRAFMRQCRSGNKEKFMNKLKEIIADDRKS
jgi:predicted RNA-binding protein YlxR (DUF448 family)